VHHPDFESNLGGSLGGNFRGNFPGDFRCRYGARPPKRLDELSFALAELGRRQTRLSAACDHVQVPLPAFSA
jgi:hypothetical protein